MQDRYTWPDGHMLKLAHGVKFGVHCPNDARVFDSEPKVDDGMLLASCVLCGQNLPPIPA